MKKTRILYSKYTDEEYLTESFKNTAPIEPNDNAVTDSEIFTGKLAGTFHGTYTEFEAGLNPLHRRGVDFTDVGNILAGRGQMIYLINERNLQRLKIMKVSRTTKINILPAHIPCPNMRR